jgi:hypothetical protein
MSAARELHSSSLFAKSNREMSFSPSPKKSVIRCIFSFVEMRCASREMQCCASRDLLHLCDCASREICCISREMQQISAEMQQRCASLCAALLLPFQRRKAEKQSRAALQRKAAQSSAKQRKAAQSSAKRRKAAQSSAKQRKAAQSSAKQRKAQTQSRAARRDAHLCCISAEICCISPASLLHLCCISAASLQRDAHLSKAKMQSIDAKQSCTERRASLLHLCRDLLHLSCIERCASL